jgi:outer membrane beta-barrel protein
MKGIIIAIFGLIISVQTYASKEDLYKFNWLDEDEVVYVLQNKEFPKDGRVGMDLFLYDSASSTYQSTLGFGLAISYSFSESWGIDVTYKSYSNSNNTDLENLLGLGDGTKPLIRKVDSAQLFHINWTPFYGKVNAFNQIFYLDWGIGIGGGQYATQTNYKTFEDKNVPLTFFEEGVAGFNFKTFFRFYTSESFNFGLQYELAGFSAIIDSAGTEDFVMYNDLSFFMGYLF